MTEETLRFDRANRLDIIVKSLNLTGKAFAKSLGISQSMASNMINGNRAITIEMVDKISLRYSHINPAWLLFNEGSMIKSEESPRLVEEIAPPYAAKPRPIALQDLAEIIFSIQEENKAMRQRLEELERKVSQEPPPKPLLP